MRESIQKELQESIDAKQKTLDNLVPDIERAARAIIASIKKGGKLILFGNGGSASDAQHIAAELVARFRKERAAIPAIALTTDTSVLTAIANDYEYRRVFARQVEALCAKNDIVLGISTSGNSHNVLDAVKMAKKIGAKTIALCGEGGELFKHTDLSLCVPSTNTPRIQECHITIGHILCKLVEDAFV